MGVAFREKVVQQGAVAAIVEMCMQRRSNSIETKRVCAAAFSALSLDGESSKRLVSEGGRLSSCSSTGDWLCARIAHTLPVRLLAIRCRRVDRERQRRHRGASHSSGPERRGDELEMRALYNLLSHEDAAKIAGGESFRRSSTSVTRTTSSPRGRETLISGS